MENLKKKGILPLEIPPMGSVALYALEIALKMRQSEQIPVFVCGVDFAFTAGKTHCKGTPAHVLQLIKANRLCPAGDVAAAFREGAFAVKSKNASQTLITDHALMGYRDAFCARFLGTPNVFDAGEQGLPLNLPRAKLESRAKTFEGAQHKAKDAEEKRDSKALRALIAKYFTSEEAALVNLRGILSGKIQMESGAREEQIFALLEGREYLFLHFPDGFSPSAETQFLTRVRAEIDFFLKDIARAKKSLNA
jgi:hypothetical protein